MSTVIHHVSSAHRIVLESIAANEGGTMSEHAGMALRGYIDAGCPSVRNYSYRCDKRNSVRLSQYDLTILARYSRLYKVRKRVLLGTAVEWYCGAANRNAANMGGCLDYLARSFIAACNSYTRPHNYSSDGLGKQRTAMVTAYADLLCGLGASMREPGGTTARMAIYRTLGEHIARERFAKARIERDLFAPAPSRVRSWTRPIAGDQKLERHADAIDLTADILSAATKLGV